MNGGTLTGKMIKAVLAFAVAVLAVAGISAACAFATVPTAAYADTDSNESPSSEPYHGGAYTMDYLNKIIETESNAVITVCDNLKGNIVVPAGKSITIDLNGHAITAADGIAAIRNLGNLTVTDSSKAQSGKIESNVPVLAAAPGSTTAFKAGTFSSTYKGNSDLIIVDPDTQGSAGKASVNIEGGMWDGSFSATGSVGITIGLGTKLSTNALVYGARFFTKEVADAVVQTSDANTFTVVSMADVRQKVYGKYYKQVQVHYYLSDAWTMMFFMGDTQEAAEALYRSYDAKGDDSQDDYQEIGSLTFEFDSNGGSAVDEVTMAADGKGMVRVESADLLPTPVRDGYAFNGWEQLVSTAGGSEEWAALAFPYSRNVGSSSVVCELRASWSQNAPQESPKAESESAEEGAGDNPAADNPSVAQEDKSALAKTSDSIPVFAVAAVAVVALIAIVVAVVAARRRRG